jgi:hypothetical protein
VLYLIQLEKHATSKQKAKGRPINLEFNFKSNARSSINTSAKRRGKGDFDESSIERGESFQSIEAVARFRVPDGFGYRLSQTTDTRSTEVYPSTTSSSHHPTPMESRAEEESFLTAAQTDVLANGGTGLMSSIQKIIPEQKNLNKVKLLVWGFREGKISAEKCLQDFLEIAHSINQKRNRITLEATIGTIS